VILPGVSGVDLTGWVRSGYNRDMARNYIKRGRPPGQPTKFTPERAQLIIEALQKHNYLSTACELAGISEQTFYNWLDRAEDYLNRLIRREEVEEEGGKYLVFFDAVKQARAGSEGELLGRIDTAGSVATLIEQRTIEHILKDGSIKTETIERWKPPDWTANAWILERTKWEKYGQHSSLDIQQAGVVFIERLQRARTAQIVEGQSKELEDIAKQPTTIEEPGQALIPTPARASEATQRLSVAPRRRPIFELIAKKKAAVSDNVQSTTRKAASTSHNSNLSEPSGNVGNQAQPGQEPVPIETDERSAAQKSGGDER
jgi:hypothetical protein